MKERISRRVVVAVALLAIGAAGVATQSQRSASSMQTAASKFLASLTPEQRQRATFAFDAQERLRWNFIPSENFPRNGLLIKDMTEAQRAAALRRPEDRAQCARLPDLHGHHPAGERAARD